MKKIYLAIVALLPIISNAQTITQSDLPTAGDYWITGNDSSYTGSVGSAGTGQTWNFSALNATEYDTIGFADPASTPYASFFPSSNLAGADIANNAYSYFTANSSG